LRYSWFILAMNKSLQMLLRLEGLTLTRTGLELASRDNAKRRFAELDHEIQKLRRRLPGEVLSIYDRQSRRYPDPVSVLIEQVCQGCRQRNAKPRVVLTSRSEPILQCEHCGRLVFAAEHAPDYLKFT
jgi:predicted  nucleic acid-binding Zn-ribbon protein